MIRKTQARPRNTNTITSGLFILLTFFPWMLGEPDRCVGAESDETFIIRDDLGRTVSIPSHVGRVVSLQDEASRIIVALGSSQALIGLDYFLKDGDAMFRGVFPASQSLPSLAFADTSVNMEAVIRLNPDVIFASPFDVHVPNALQEKTGKPVVAVSSLGHFDKLLNEVRLIGRVLGRSERAEELIGYFRETIERVSRMTGRIAEEQRPRVYLAFWSMLTRTPVSYDPLNVAGGRNLAAGLAPNYPGSDGAVVSVETVVRWDPDIILVHGNYPPNERKVTVESVLADRRLQSVKAVRNKRVFYTFGFWSWWDPAEVLVETLYLAKLLHPGLFRDLDLVQEANAIYKAVYGIDNGYDLLRQTIHCDEWLKE